MIPKAREVPESLFRVSTPKETEDMSVSLPCIGQVVHCHFISHVFIFASSPLVVGKAWKTKLTQQWICSFMENPMVQLTYCIHKL